MSLIHQGPVDKQPHKAMFKVVIVQKDLHEIGAHLVVGLQGPCLTSTERSLLATLRPLGVILFARNIDRSAGEHWPEMLQSLLRETHELCGRKPFLVTVDHEGGRVNRLPPPVTHFPPACSWGSCAKQVGQVMGRELSALGINVNYAPVLDVCSEPRNTVIGDRAFSSDAESVCKRASEFISGLQSEGVLACGKHFPGHGATVEDSHLELPVLNADRALLESRELVPFAGCARGDLKLMMTAHVRYPALDKDHPATVSANIITSILRRDLGFDGVVVSDDLGMQALRDIPVERRPAMLLGAGVDIMLAGNFGKTLPLERALEDAHSLLTSLDKGELSESLLVQSKARIDKLLGFLKSISQTAPPSSKETLGCPEHSHLLTQIKNSQ